jgi:N-acetylglutamate synthase-like GNAT family acetyltransferase
MRDCKDILTIYQTTRWLRRRYSTVEEVKTEHRAFGFNNWGWLVAEHEGQVVGEIIIGTEKNPASGPIGLIRSIDVDIRYQKKNIGAQLVHAAEETLKTKRVGRVVTNSPPEAYNFWMKIKYFARGSLFEIEAPVRGIPTRNTARLTAVPIDPSDLPKDWVFSLVAPPGELLTVVGEISEGKRDGRILEFYSGKILTGLGAVVRSEGKRAQFVADCMPQGIDCLEEVISKTAKLSSSLKATSAFTRVASDYLHRYQGLADWSTVLSQEIAVNRFL